MIDQKLTILQGELRALASKVARLQKAFKQIEDSLVSTEYKLKKIQARVDGVNQEAFVGWLSEVHPELVQKDE